MTISEIPLPIITFTSAKAPAKDRWLAFFYQPGKKGLVRLPVVFNGPTEEAVIAGAEKFWADEVAKEQAALARSVKP